MQTKINKDELLAILRQNREAHRAIFDEAVVGYKNEAVKQLEAHIERIKRGKMEQVSIYLPVPENHTKDYDRVIKSVELHTEPTVELNPTEVAQFVMDDWQWKRQFLASNSTYSATAQSSLSEYDND